MIEFLATTRMGEKGQLTVPKEFRDALGVHAGAPFAVLRFGDGLILLPEQQRLEQVCRRIQSVLLASDRSASTILRSLPDARKRVYERRYGGIGLGSPTNKRRRV